MPDNKYIHDAGCKEAVCGEDVYKRQHQQYRRSTSLTCCSTLSIFILLIGSAVPP